ncbi:TetR/AcrR family transcriptional regulator [Halostella litorea]|uniref:TetR/AcrR family transcriptional regulator n=1 Tax=Halostella litorea TaxID=2528831 RepID=UPI001091FEAA|nr:TetR/AcrR family transcriptional regulator [Halostella litorea]
MDDEPATEILEATYRALCDNGYADLTLQDIAAEADVSKASIHYHYECKDQLFIAFLDLLYERYTDRLDELAGDTPRERLDSLLELLLTDGDGSLHGEFRTAMLEVNAQAPYDAAVRERLADFDEYLHERLRAILVAGVEAGEFDDGVEPSLAAEFLVTAIRGAHTRQVAVGHSPDRLYATMTRYAERQLFAGDGTEVAP